MKDLMVSVPLLVYNQEEYVRQCLDNILRQKVNFSFEVLVGDDCSTDHTQEILQEYGENYPDVFKLILRKKNIGITKNLYDLLRRCKGKYIAGLEGDDYWLDENKLQKQFDFMESHPEYIGCSHAVKMVDSLGQELPLGKKYIEGCHWSYYQNTFTYKQYQNFEMPGQGSTWFYRNIYLHPKYDYSIIEKISPVVGDRTVMLLLAAQGDWYYMAEEEMTCYRYITEEDKDSWASWARQKNRSLDNMKMDIGLERYAREVFHKQLDFREEKIRVLRGALDWYESERTVSARRENRRILVRCWRLVHPKIWYFIRILRSEIYKKIYISTVEYALRNNELISDDDILLNSSWREFNKECHGKTLVLFGRGLGWVEFMRRYGTRYNPMCLLDNNRKEHGGLGEIYRRPKDMWSDSYDFTYVMSPNVVKDWMPDSFVVLITSSLYQNQMAKQLREMGFYNYYSFGIMESKKWRYRLLRRKDM